VLNFVNSGGLLDVFCLLELVDLNEIVPTSLLHRQRIKPDWLEGHNLGENTKTQLWRKPRRFAAAVTAKTPTKLAARWNLPQTNFSNINSTNRVQKGRLSSIVKPRTPWHVWIPSLSGHINAVAFAQVSPQNA